MTLDRTTARARCDAATEGPWVNIPDGPLFGLILAAGDHICEMPPLDDRTEDFDFIAHARTDLPAALDEIDRLEGECERLRGWLSKLQYAGTAHGAYGTTADRCPECGGIAPGQALHTGSFDGKYRHGEGHKADCGLWAALEGRD